MEINSRMIDLKNCLTAKESDVDGYRDIFMQWAYPAVSKARYLSKYLLDEIHGEGKNIIQLAAELSRCNLTAMDIMRNDSLELMSDGMLIEMTWLRMYKNFSLDIVSAFWENELHNVVSGFQTQNTSCSSKERKHALEDLENTDDITQLQTNNAERYQWAWNDVFVIDNGIPGAFRYYEVDSKKFLLHTSNGKTKIVTYSKTMEPVSAFTEKSLSKFVKEKIANGSDNAGEIAAAVKGAITATHSALLVYFNGAKFQPSKVIDQESQAIRADTDKAYIDYCSSAFCPINWGNWLNVEGSITGYFTVYVVIDNSNDTSLPVSDGATFNALSLCLFWICIIRLVEV